jgi:anti-sigma regulatory factor (Ser/Thr protein kinase)
MASSGSTLCHLFDRLEDEQPGYRAYSSDSRRDGDLVTKEYTFVLSSDLAQISPMVEFLAEEITQLVLCDAMERMRIALALEEALVNALYHGNLEIRSNDDCKPTCIYEEAQVRCCRPPFSDRRIFVRARINRSAAQFVIRDEGQGFDPSRLPDPTDDANLGRASGRGIYLMRSLMDEVTFNEVGNEVTMIRRWLPAVSLAGSAIAG